jgi:hypothetical protein
MIDVDIGLVVEDRRSPVIGDIRNGGGRAHMVEPARVSSEANGQIMCRPKSAYQHWLVFTWSYSDLHSVLAREDLDVVRVDTIVVDHPDIGPVA